MSDTLTPSVRNITKLFRTATPEQIAVGADWYRDAHEIATALAVKNGTTVAIAAGVLAAVSPLQSWGANVNLAARILSTPGGLTAGYLGVGLAKARKILAGEDILATLNGNKIQNFYLGILTAGEAGVCIDRHAWSLAVNHRYSEGNIPSLSGKRYGAAVAAYTRAAVILSKEYGMALTPAQVQSVTWTLWRNKFWAVGAFDKHGDI
jgi:hypothetical protein